MFQLVTLWLSCNVNVSCFSDCFILSVLCITTAWKQQWQKVWLQGVFFFLIPLINKSGWCHQMCIGMLYVFPLTCSTTVEQRRHTAFVSYTALSPFLLKLTGDLQVCLPARKFHLGSPESDWLACQSACYANLSTCCYCSLACISLHTMYFACSYMHQTVTPTPWTFTPNTPIVTATPSSALYLLWHLISWFRILKFMLDILF